MEQDPISHVKHDNACQRNSENDTLQSEVPSSLARVAKDHGLPQQILHALLACGYNTITSIAKIETVSSIEEFLRDSHELFDAGELKKIYGRFASVPERFRFLPGHVAQLQVFIDHCRDRGVVEMSKCKCDSTSKFGTASKRRFPIPRHRSEASETERGTDRKTNYSSTIADLQSKMEKWCRLNSDPNVGELKNNVHYRVGMNVEECGTSDSEGTPMASAFITCCMCSSSIVLQPQRDNNFCLSNAYRHLKNCANKTGRLGQVVHHVQDSLKDHQYGSNSGRLVLHIISAECDELDKTENCNREFTDAGEVCVVEMND